MMSTNEVRAGLTAAAQPPAVTRDTILKLLDHWIRQRPGLEFGNYGDVANYRQESRRITRQKRDAETLLRAVMWRSSIDVPQLKEAFGAFSGRLQFVELPKPHLEYCTGQYWPTEYRAAACAVLASALWEYARNNIPAEDHPGSAGDWLRDHFRKEFGRHIAERWFN
jgi:hypothetical protein